MVSYLVHWAHQQTGASVHNGHTGASAAQSLILQHDALHGHLPVARVAVHLNIGHVSFIEGWIRSSQDHFSSQLSLRITVEPK